MAPRRPRPPFYAYMLCDLTPGLKNMAGFAGRTRTPDSDGYFGDGANDGVSVEIVSFHEMVDDAKDRNAAPFEKRGQGHPPAARRPGRRHRVGWAAPA